MDSQTIRTALGRLQVDPESADDWALLERETIEQTGDLEPDELSRLFNAAREQHAQRGEWEAVAKLLDLEVRAATDTPREPPLLRERTRVFRDELFDDSEAEVSLLRMLEIDPQDSQAAAALEELESKRSRHADLENTYLAEAENAPDEVYKSSMLMRAAEMQVRFASNGDLRGALERLEQAVRLDPTNATAARMLEVLYRREERWEDAARVLERLTERADNAQVRAQAGVRLARLLAHRLEDSGRAAVAYEAVLKELPQHEEARRFLSEHYSSEERWDELVQLYERELSTKDTSHADQLGDMLQIAMLHWKKRQRPQDAEAWFERIRKLEPAHPLMLNFYREYAAQLDDDARLIEVLQSAQRVMKEGPDKRRIASELAKLAEGQKNAQRAIEQYKSVLRQDPDNGEAREALKRLYKQTQSHNALVELLRQQLERTPAEQYQARLEILREVATVYRQYIKSDTALVSVLNQVVQLDEKLDVHDVDEMRELVQLYEKLGRWRDLLTNQLKLAEITTDVEEKKALYRTAARRWLEQFSNVQNATEAYEALLKVAPDDREARERLHELYHKRRAWPALFELYKSELESLEGESRLAALKEMAQLAAERLGRSDEAVRLYREIVQSDPSRTDALDALEKHAERSKDYKTLAEALERRSQVTSDEAGKLNLLQKLGAVYAEHLGDHQAAASAWRRILELQPGHHRALRVLRDTYLHSGDYDGLTDLYASQNDWEGLAEVLSGAADRARETAAKIELSYRAAAVYEDRLAQPDRAFRSYERILSVDPTDARAAGRLIPLYEKDEKWARLPALYELVYDHATDEAQKLELLTRLVDVTGTRLNDRRAAAAYARKAYELAPSSETALDLLERAARAAGSWDQFAESLEARLAALGAGAPAEPAEAPRGKKGKKRRKTGEEPVPVGAPHAERRMLRLKLARVYADELGRSDQAIATYKALVEQDPTDEACSNALEQMLRRTDRRDELRWLLDLRVQHTPSDLERVRILKEWALLEEDAFEAPERAIQIYTRTLEIEPADEEALKALPRLLLAQGDAAEAARVIEAHRDGARPEQQAALDAELAELYAGRLERPDNALDAAVRTLGSNEYAQRGIAVLEALMEQPGTRARAAEILVEQYANRGDARREAAATAAMLDQASGGSARRELYLNLAGIHEQKLGAFGTALDVLLRAVREFPQDLELWDRAEQLAVKAGRPTDLADAYREILHSAFERSIQIELCERAARLHEDKLGDPMGATPYLEKVLSLDPGSERAFLRLKDILTGAERWSELCGLYDRAVDAAEDAGRRTELLVEVALICEEITEEPLKATRYYERILESDPLHEQTLRALDRLYVKQERHADLARLLERRLTSSTGDELLQFKLRLAHIQLERLHEPDQAMAHVEDVLGSRVNDYEARELAERMLEIGNLRGRAARVLEAVYENRDEIRDLVRVLEIRLEAFKPAEGAEPVQLGPAEEEERRDLLRRIAELRDERLHDSQGALDTLAELVPSEPLDTDARQRLIEVGRRLGAHQRVADVLSKAAESADTAALKAEILMNVAGIYDNLLGDTPRAESNYRRVMMLDEADASLVLPAAQALERIYLAGREHQKLAEVLRVQVRLEQDGDRRRELLGRLGELCAGVLDDVPAAIEAWSARLEDAPTDERALAALDALYVRAERWRELVDVLERRRDIADDSALRQSVMLRAAETLADRLGDSARAIEAWRALVDEFGPSAQVLTALERLYEQAERWDDLADSYEAHLDVATGDAERLELLAKLGDVKRQHQRDLEGALATYRRALTLDTRHQASRQALEALLESEDTPTRREASEILLPIYESEGEHHKLLRVLDIQIDASDDPQHKVELLERATEEAESALGDKSRAYDYAARVLKTALGHMELRPRLDRLDKLAAATGRHADQVRLLSEIVPDVFDGETQLYVTLKVAELARHQLADRDLARTYYQKALEIRPDDKPALSALESLYEETGDARSLLDVLDRRIEVAESDSDRKQLMFRRARLLAEVLGEKQRAIEAYESILDLGLEQSAIEALRGLYADEQRWQDSIQLYQRELDAKQGSPAELRVEMAKILSTKLNDSARALDELEEALAVDRQHAGAIAELERLLNAATDAEYRARAAGLLEPVYLARADYAKLMSAIQARLAFTDDAEERRELLRRLAQLYEEQAEDYVAALDTTAKLLHQDIADEGTQQELERLAKVAGAEKRLAEIYAAELELVTTDDPATARLAARTGELFATLSSFDRALAFYRRALAFEPESRKLFAAVDDILRRTDRHEERVQLYRDALEQRFEPKERLELLHTIASLQRNELGRVEEAIETYRAALDVEERDKTSLDALTQLYRDKQRFEDLADLHLRRAENSDDVSEAAQHRLALAGLLRRELAQIDRAIDQLDEIVRTLPSHKEAIRELESLRERPEHKQRVVEILRPLYEAADDWRHLIKLNEDRFSLAVTPVEKVDVLRETARLWEARGGDKNRARSALAIAFELDPNDMDVRGEYERLVAETKAWDELAQTYDSVLNDQPDLASRREILVVLARVHDQERDDPRSALNAYDRLYETDPSEIEPLSKMEQLSTLLSDWPTLVRVLTAKAELILDAEERASVWRRVGEAKRDMLDDAPGALDAYERALEDEPESTFTIDCLVELYEARENPQRLVELYQRRVELTQDDDDLKYELLRSAARTYEEKLADRQRAIEVLTQALAVKPADGELLGALNRLYRTERMWPELLDNLKLQASSAADAAERARLRREIGAIYAQELNDYEQAVDAYRLVIEENPGDEPAIAELQRLGQEHEELREPVAQVLVPALRGAGRYETLVEALEMRLTTESDPVQRADTLRTIGEVLEQKLERREAAQAALLRALAERPEDAELHAEIERLSEPGGFGRYADALLERAQATFDPDLACDLYSRLGKLAEERLNDNRRAVEAYQRAVEHAGDRPELLAALDRLYTQLDDAQALSEVLERRISAESSDSGFAELNYRLAQLQIDKFKDRGRAVGFLRAALERVPEHDPAIAALEKLTDERELFDETSDVLENVYRARGNTDRLAALYEKRVGFAATAAERIDMRRDLARVLEDDAKDLAGAQRVLQQGLGDDPTDQGLLDEIERLAGTTGDWSGAAGALHAALESQTDILPDLARELSLRLAKWYRDKVSDPIAAEKALMKALDQDPSSDEVLLLLEELQRSPGRERDLIATLRRRAPLQLGDDAREALYREAKGLADRIGDAQLAEEILREVLQQDDGNLWALAELTTLREQAGDFRETFELLTRRAELRAQGDVVRELRHRAAAIAREKLSEPTKAVTIYEQLFEDDPADSKAAAQLRELYQAGAQFQNLSQLLDRLIDLADTPAERSRLRLELAELNERQFQAYDTAINLLRDVLYDDPAHSEAVVRLSELLEKTKRDEELAELLATQIDAARARGDQSAELTFQVRLGEIYDSRLGDRAKAIETYRSVLEREPEHHGALEALARLLRSEGRVEEASRTLERLLDKASGADAVRIALELADDYEKLGKSDECCAALERGLAADRSSLELRDRLRKIYSDAKNWDKLATLVAEDAEFAGSEEQKVAALRQAASIHSRRRDDHARAAELLDRASQIRPTDREILLELCDEYSASGRGKAAAEVLERIVDSYGGKRSKELADIHRRLADAYLAEGEKHKALEELDKAFRIEPGNVSVLKRLGEVALDAGDYKKAQQMFRALLLQKLEAESPITKAEVFFYLGETHLRLDEKPKAIQMYERAVQQDDSFNRAKTRLAELKG